MLLATPSCRDAEVGTIGWLAGSYRLICGNEARPGDGAATAPGRDQKSFQSSALPIEPPLLGSGLTGET